MRLLIVLLMLPMLVACEYKALVFDDSVRFKVKFNIDWSDICDLPSGVTILFYPTDGGRPIEYVTNDTEDPEIDLPVGTYNILVFNQSVDEYHSVTFHNMDNWDEAYIELADEYGPSWSTRSSNFSAEPAELMVGTAHNFAVTVYQVNTTTGEMQTLNIHPHPVLIKTDVHVNVTGIQYARSIRSVVVGMAKRYYLTRNCTGPQLTNFTLPEWEIIVDSTETSKGFFFTDFISFGLPNVQYDEEDLQTKSNYTQVRHLRSRSSRSGVATTRSTGGGFYIPSGPPGYYGYKTRASMNLVDPLYLDIDVLLVDGKTIVSKTFQVADRAQLEMKNLQLNVSVGVPIDNAEDPDANNPLDLPHVENTNQNGFQVGVTEWGDEEIHEIEL